MDLDLVDGDWLGEYRSAAIFSRILLELYPEEALGAMLDTENGSDYLQVRDRLVEHGIDLDDAVGVYETELEDVDPRKCSTDGVRIPISACAIEPSPWLSPSIWRLESSISCDDPGTIGPSRENVWTTRTVEVTEPGEYTITVRGDFFVFGQMAPCEQTICESAAEGDPSVRWHLFRGSRVVQLKPGRYWIRFSREVKSPDSEYLLEIKRNSAD